MIYQMEADRATLCTTTDNVDFMNCYGPQNRNPLVVITDQLEIPLFILFSARKKNDLTASDEVAIYHCCMLRSPGFRDLFLQQKWRTITNGNQLTLEKQLIPECPLIMICDVPVFHNPDATYPGAYIVKHSG